MNTETTILEGVILAMTAFSKVKPAKLIPHRKLTPSERMLAHAERIGPPKEIDTGAERFQEAPTEDLLLQESYFSDSREPEHQKPAFTKSYWDPHKRRRESWQS